MFVILFHIVYRPLYTMMFAEKTVFCLLGCIKPNITVCKRSSTNLTLEVETRREERQQIYEKKANLPNPLFSTLSPYTKLLKHSKRFLWRKHISVDYEITFLAIHCVD